MNKIDFATTPYLNVHQQTKISAPNGDESSSSDNSLYSESPGSDNDETILIVQREPIDGEKPTSITYRCKNSVENLSEDSGYCEYSSLKMRSKSIPNFNSQPEHFIEEEEFENHKSLENVITTSTTSTLYVQQQQHHHHHYTNATYKHSASYSSVAADNEPTTAYTTKIESTTKRYVVDAPPPTYTIVDDACMAKNIMRNAVPLRHASQNISASLPNLSEHIDSSSSSAASSDDETFSAQQRGTRRADIYLRKTTASTSRKQKQKTKNTLHQCGVGGVEKDFSIVSSVPCNLNICTAAADDEYANEFGWNLVGFAGSYSSGGSKNSHSRTTVASKNFDLGDFASGGSGSYVPQIDTNRQQKVINASYSNLTALDYSGVRQQLTTTFRKMAADNRNKRNSGEFSRCNFLLDEISTHFDRELSILNDQRENYDPVAKFIHEEKMAALAEDVSSSSTSTRSTPPKPPPRKMHLQQKVYSEHNSPLSVPIVMAEQQSPPRSLPPNVPQQTDMRTTSFVVNAPSSVPIAAKIPPSPAPSKYTFDRDPTNLVTCYAESLERCNFDVHGSTNSINSNKNLDSCLIPNIPSRHATPVHRQMVQSTPNLNIYKMDDRDEYLQVSSTHTSLNPLPQQRTEEKIESGAVGGVLVNCGEKLQGILSLGSRSSLGKGVSFCPIVSEISWKEQSSEEIVDDDDGDTECADDSLDCSAENIARYSDFLFFAFRILQ